VTRAEIVRLRLGAQRICATSLARLRPADVVATLGAVQAQDYLGALWAVGLRSGDASERDVERALAERTIVRTWPMRGTLHLVAAADARWMTELLAARPAAAAAGRLRSYGIDEQVLRRARRALARSLEGGRRRTRPDLYRVLDRAKVPAAGERGLHVLWRLAQDCVLCFGPREGKQQTFVLFDEWLPKARRLPRDEALAELAHRYFAGHGPATLADLAWWSGLKVADARLAVALAGRRIEERKVGGESMWLSRSSPASAPPARGAYILPAFDEFLVGYADRSAAVDPAHAPAWSDGGGLLKPTIVAGGRVVGTWKRRIDGRELLFSPSLRTALRPSDARALDRAVGRYARFLGLELRSDFRSRLR
jgi:hypothetical protein